MFRLFARLLITALGLIALGGTVGFAQSGQLSGRVTDPQGAAIPDASVLIVNQERNFKRDTKTDGLGAYSAPYLPAGRYQVSAQKDGFSGANRVIQLTVGQSFVLDIQMTVASTSTDVTVQAEANNSSIELDTASLSTTCRMRK
jgi:hypothetical protein